MKAFNVIAACCMSLSHWAFAQSVNIDYGWKRTSPSPAYGAAAGQPGHWNVVESGKLPTIGLLDVNGEITHITITQFLPFGVSEFDHPSTRGNEELLFDDYWDLHSTPHTAELTGFDPGAYSIYTYAWAPDNVNFKTSVMVNETDPQVIGGAWPGGQALGITYALHEFTIADPDDVVYLYTFGFNKGTLNGIQIVKHPPLCPADIAPEGGGNGTVDVDDLLAVINGWGACQNECEADIAPAEPVAGDGVVDVDDLLAVINSWGTCD